MGKITGFMQFRRQDESYEPTKNRIKHYREFVAVLDDEHTKLQSARCMDCGTPFCNNGCPINNIIPDFNDLVHQGRWQQALQVLHSTNNFPEFTGRICPAPCESACTLDINDDAVGIKSIERAIVDKGWQNGWIIPQVAQHKTHKKVAVVGSGPSGLACAQQLARSGHDVSVFEKNDRIGGLLRYGIPDFKMEKRHIDVRMQQMQAEGVRFSPSTVIGEAIDYGKINNFSKKTISVVTLLKDFDAVVLCTGAEVPRDLPIESRESDGIHFAMELLAQQNKINAGDQVKNAISAKGKHVVVIGGGDTGSDCVGTSHRHGAKSVTQFELMPKPPEHEDKHLEWPNWPYKLRTSSSHQEGGNRDWAVTTKAFIANKGKVTGLLCARVSWEKDKLTEISGSEFELPADLVLFAMGFIHTHPTLCQQLKVNTDNKRGNIIATDVDGSGYQTNVSKVFSCGDSRRGQSLVVWAIREGRQCAREVDGFLMQRPSLLPR